MVFTCNRCDRSFTSTKGLNKHRWHCIRKELAINRRDNDPNVSNNDTPVAPDISDILDQDELCIEFTSEEEIWKPDLPAFVPVKKISNLPCYEIAGKDFVQLIDNAYDEITQWRKTFLNCQREMRQKNLSPSLRSGSNISIEEQNTKALR